MIGYEDHQATLTLEGAEGCLECPATYTMRVEWYRGKVTDLIGCTLDTWTFAGREHNRREAVDLIGEAEVTRQEAITGTLFWDQPHGIAAE